MNSNDEGIKVHHVLMMAENRLYHKDLIKHVRDEDANPKWVAQFSSLGMSDISATL